MPSKFASLPLLCLAFGGSVANAQSAPPQFQSFRLDRFQVDASAKSGLLAADGAIMDKNQVRTQANLQFQNRPLEAARNGQDQGALISQRYTLAISAAWSPVKNWEVGAELPMVRQSYGANAPTFFSESQSYAVASPSAYARYGLFENATRNVTLHLGATFPVRTMESFASERTLAMNPRVYFGQTLGYFRLASHVGATLRGQSALAGRTFGHDVDASIGAATRGDSLRFEAVVNGNYILADSNAAVELLGGARYFLRGTGLDVFVMGGPGLSRAVGTPQYRVMSGLSFSPQFGQQQRISPVYTRPEPKPFMGPVAMAWIDSDNDGVQDSDDRCVSVPGIESEFGCPAPILDTDKDTVADAVDNCPMQAGPESNAGCPEEKKQMVVIKDDGIEIRQRVFFVVGKSTLDPKSLPLLDQVAEVLSSHPDMPAIEVAGHTDSRGKAEKNRTPSQARAEEVCRYLESMGVEKNRLQPMGYGADRPLLHATSEIAFAVNRRVEFNFKKVEQPSTTNVSQIQVQEEVSK